MVSWNVRLKAHLGLGVRIASHNFAIILLFLISSRGQCGAVGPVIVVPAPSAQSFYLMIDPTLVAEADRSKVKISFIKDSITLWTRTIDVPSLKSSAALWVNYATWGTGELSALVQQVNPDNSLTDIGSIPLRIPLVQSWTSFTCPTTPLVPPPYTAVQVNGNTASVWGRQYTFGNSIFLDQVNSAGEDILASPITLTGTVNGQVLQWTVKSWSISSVAEDKVIYTGSATSGPFNIAITATLEFDGCLRFDYTLTPVGGSQTVKDLALVVPVKRSVAKSFMQSTLSPFNFYDFSTWNRSGDVTSSGWSCAFAPFFWLGDQRRGIQWFAESHLGWTPSDTNKYLEVSTTENAATLICHIADGYRTISSPLSFTFGVMASPIRPRPSNCDMSGYRTIVLSEPSQLTNASSQRSGIIIPASKADFSSAGCVEANFRADWNPESPTSLETDLPLIQVLNSQAYQIRVHWYTDGTYKYLRLMQWVPETGLQTIAQAKVSFTKGSWHRLALNYGTTSEVYLDGSKIISAALPGRLPFWDFYSAWMIGGGGRMTLSGWKISKVNRHASELQSGPAWTSDSDTVQLETLETDPTPLNLTNPLVGSASSPGYLSGSWSYDPYTHWLTAGPDGPSITGAERLARMGVKGVVLFGWSTINNGMGDIANPDVFFNAGALCDKYGIKMIPYAPWGMADTQEWYQDYIWEMTYNAPNITPTPQWVEAPINFYGGCPASSRAKLNLYEIDRLMANGASGLYLDGQVYPVECGNPLHGHAVTDPLTGKATSYARIFDMREYMKNMYRLIISRRPDAIIDAHCSSAFTLPTMSFVTEVTNGESLGVRSDWADLIEPQCFRAEYHTRQYGFNGDALFYNNSPVPLEMGMAITGIHGQTPRCMWGLYPERAAAVWKLVDAFDTNSANWMPYYYPEESAFHPESSTVYASAFVHPGKNALLLVTNWSNTDCSGMIDIDWNALGLSPNSPVKVVNLNKLIQVKNGAIDVPLKQKQLTYVLIGSMADDPASGYIYHDDFENGDYSLRYTSDLIPDWQYLDSSDGNIRLQPSPNTWYTTISTKDYKNGHFTNTSYQARLHVKFPNNYGPSISMSLLNNGWRGLLANYNPAYYGYEVGLYNYCGALVLLINRVNRDGTVTELYQNWATPYSDVDLSKWATITGTVNVKSNETCLKLEWSGVSKNGMPVSYSCEYSDTSSARWTSGIGIGIRGYPGDYSGGLVIDDLSVIGNYTGIKNAKAAPENAEISLDNAVITRSFKDYFYVESDDRALGIRVNWPSNRFAAKTRVNVTGIAATNDDSERCIDAGTAVACGTGSVEPLAMTNRSLGGSDWNYDILKAAGQRGIAGSVGPCNIGLLIKTTGRVISQNGCNFTITDGSVSPITVNMLTDTSWIPVGSYVTITGISSCTRTSNGTLVPLIRVRATSDVQQIEAPNS